VACPNPTITHNVGDTFHYVGGLRSAGAPLVLTGWQVLAFVRATDASGEEAAAGDPLTTPVVVVTNAAQGAFVVRADDTTAWPRNARLLLEVVLIAPDATRTTLPYVTIQT
jgi:hypothetical protein